MNARLLALTLPLLAGAAFAQQPRLLTKETLMDMEAVGSPSISPDGRHILFTRTWVDKMKDQSQSNVWITDREGRRVRELTPGPWRDTSPVWSPNGEQLAFLSDRDGTTQLHVMWLDTREVAQLTRLEHAPGSIRWSPDGTRIAYTAFVPDRESPLPIRLPERPAGAQWARGATVVDRATWASDGRGPLPVGHTHVCVVDARLGGTPRQVTSGKYDHGSPEWSRDGKTLLVSAIRKPEAEFQRGDTEIYRLDLDTLAIRALTDRKGPDGNPRVSPDGRWIAYTGYDDKRYTSHLSSLYLMDMNGGSKKVLATDLTDSPQSVAWAPDSSGLYFTVNELGSSNVHFVPLNSRPQRITEGVHMLTSISVADDGTVAAIRSEFTRPPHLVRFSTTRPRELETLVDVNEDLLAGTQLSGIEELWFTAPDGVRAQGWLVKPANFEPGKKYPLVLWIHGGPWSMYNTGWNWAWQNFAAEGYAVLYTNPRGSTGYGQEFVNGIQYSYPGKDYDDLMAGVDEALKRGWVDEKNLFVCGGSGGGVLTAWIVGKTDRFAAAVSMRPVINWHSFVGTTDGVSWYDQFRRYPWEDPMEYHVRSPLSLVGNVKTPTMVMTGEADLRTPMSQSEEYYRALKMLRVPTLLVRMPEEYHGWRRPSRQLAQQLYLMAWFERHRRP
jgi:dipeptidyl aminopeptidase/acylaminoacyl peptidase